jgi:hypothetical protein
MIFNSKRIEKIENHLSSLATTSRTFFSRFIDTSHSDKRNLYNEFGYPVEPTLNQYYARYERQDITKRLVDAYPNACWTGDIVVTDDDESMEESRFKDEFNEIASKLNLYEYIRRADIAGRLGRYSILLIGVRDGQTLDQPISKKLRLEDILYTTPYMEKDITINKFNVDPTSERFGKPEIYTVAIGNNDVSAGKTLEIHYSRLIHIAEDSIDNDIYGIPYLKPLYNRLMDLDKVIGSGAELFWKNGRGGLNMNAPIDHDIADPESLKDQMNEFDNHLTRYLRTKGMDVKTLNYNVPDPEKNFNVLMRVISGTSGIPLRVLTGSERGELASTQDAVNWNDRVSERRRDVCEPKMLRPLIDWFILNGVLSTPRNEEYFIIWPEYNNVSDLDRADIALKMSTAIEKYTNAPKSQEVVTKEQFVEGILQLEYLEDQVEESVDEEDQNEENLDMVEPENPQDLDEE